jgi:hypothetical protein
VLAAFGLVVVCFIAVSIAARRLVRAQDAERYYITGLLRLEGRQAEGVADGKSFEPEDHLYAQDLDVFGPQSLFSMLNMARTSAGQETLASWLLAPAPTPEEIVARQAAVRELAAAVDLRENLWRAAGMVGRTVKPHALVAWLSATPEPVTTMARLAAFAVGLIGLAGLVALFAGLLLPAITLFVVVWVLARRFRPYVRSVGEGAQNRADELTAVVKLAEIVEATPFSSEKLLALKAALGSAERPARHAVNKLLRLVGWFEMRRSALLALLGTPVLAFTQFAMAIEIWRKDHGAAAAKWISAIGELEALTSLGTYAFEHPELPFPEIVADSEGPRFEGEAVAHPLLPSETRVANDVSLHPQRRLLLVTGSNMSGKSTYLRTIGTNTVLALAGAPVVAKRLRLSRLMIGASLRTSDSLQAGVSRFFAEIQRLRSIVDLCEKNALALYLLDEILHGTNSEDRLAGGGALIKRLCERGSVGLCTTHDLALARIVDDLGAVAVNVHFEDVISDGKITFDYRLRSGVVTRGNAIALMKLVGLPV